MAPYISLDKTTFYKDDISSGKIYINGTITGLDSNKEYCARWKCINNSSKYHVHGSVDYFYITNTTQISLTNNSAHIHTDNLTLDTGKNYATVYIYVDAVQYNCENIKEELAGYQVIRIYDINKPAEPGILNCTSDPDGAGIYIDYDYYGHTNLNITDLDPGSYYVKFTKYGYEDYSRTITIESNKTTYMSKTLVLIDDGEGNADIINVNFKDDNESTITEAEANDIVHAAYSIKNTGDGGDTLYSQALIDGLIIATKESSITKGSQVNYTTDKWYMRNANSILSIKAGHYENNTKVEDDTFTKTINLKEPCIPDWQCEVPLSGYEIDGCGNRRYNADCEPCVPDWKCEIPLNGYEADGCGNRRTNPVCEPCISNWQCEVPLNGYEADGCGNRRLNSACGPCIPNWQCEVPLNGYEADGCGNRRYNADCEPYVPLEEELIEEPSYIIPIVIGAGVITAVGLFILSQKK